jgi:SAM-dependent methyltransferase
MTDWEQCYQTGVTPWDKGVASPPLAAWLAGRRLTGRALVPGCGLGHDLALVAAAGAEATGLDIAPTAVAQARAIYPQLDLMLGDLLALPDEWLGRFDWIFEHTCLCALPPGRRGDYEQAVARLLRPGGRLVGIWFIEPEMDPGESGPPFALPLAELDALFPSTRWRVLDDAVPEVAYPGRLGRERLRVLERRS